MQYSEFLKSKELQVPNVGFEVLPGQLNPKMFPFQRDIVSWMLRCGRAGCFADTGLGKSAMQIEFCHQTVVRTGRPALICAPLAVNQQTALEGKKFDRNVTVIRSMKDVDPAGINIINYEMLDHIDPFVFGTVVLDEGDILANYSGVIKKSLVEMFRDTPYRATFTATPTPNEVVELTNQADFLGIMKPSDMLNLFFTTRIKNKEAAKFALNPRAEDDFYRWMARWAVAIKRPSDFGYSDEGYILPPLTINKAIVGSSYKPEGQLFHTHLKGVTERAKVRRTTLPARVELAVEILQSEPDEPWIVWCGLNEESELIAKLLPGAVEVRGSDTPEQKAQTLLDFASGKIKVLVTKPKIAGSGLNFQVCARQMFVGLSDSYRAYYQCIRRSYRFGQTREVKVWIVLSDKEEVIYENVLRKETEAGKWTGELLARISGNQLGQFRPKGEYNPGVPLVLPDWLRSVA